ncbi:MAG: hypothetical protein U5L11_15895 [Arhodomonas sp.]|nr:hypothetical protein [Arhodomonas sp.]
MPPLRRRRLRTALEELMNVAAVLSHHARRRWLALWAALLGGYLL